VTYVVSESNTYSDGWKLKQELEGTIISCILSGLMMMLSIDSGREFEGTGFDWKGLIETLEN
jgi:hypothetical protein